MSPWPSDVPDTDWPAMVAAKVAPASFLPTRIAHVQAQLRLRALDDDLVLGIQGQRQHLGLPIWNRDDVARLEEIRVRTQLAEIALSPSSYTS